MALRRPSISRKDKQCKDSFGANLMHISWKGSALLVGTACTRHKCTVLCAGGSRKSLPGGALGCGILSYWVVCMDLLVDNQSVGDFLRRLCAFKGN